MKKILFFASALAALFLAASCQRESLEPEVSGNVVSYTIQVPGALSTKVIGENVSAVNELVYEVYRTEATAADDYTQTETKLFQKTAVITDGTATVDFELVNNQNFRVLFWAQCEGNGVYTIPQTNGLKNVTLSQSLTANAESYAAFAGSDFIKYGDNINGRTVTLVRPIAQLNIATAPGSLSIEGQTTVKMTTTGVTVTGLSTSYNVAQALAGDVATTPFTYTAAALSGLSEQTLSVNGTAYDYVAMNYVGFAEQSGSNVEVSYTINTENVGTISNTIKNVPVKANYRTNIVGNLITSMSDYTITLDAEWEDEEKFVEIWDGKTLTAPDFDPATETWTIDNGAELAWMAQAVNGTLPAVTTKSGEELPAYAEDHKIVLGGHIHLGGCEWIPIGTNAKHFKGSFDGAGYTIYDFKVSKRNGGDQAALFGTVSGSPTFRNLTIEGAKVIYPGEGDFYAAALVGTAYGNLTIENVTVQKSEISGNNKVAGLWAHDGVISSLNIDNCHVLDCKIESLNKADGGNVGGLIGLFQGVPKGTQPAPYGDHIIKNSSVKNTVINAINSTNTGKRSNGEFVACLSGKANQTLVIEDCEVSGNTFTQNEGVTYVSPYGVFVGGNRNDDGKGTVIVDGKEMIAEGLVKEEDTYYVSTAASLQTAIDLVAEGETVAFTDDVEAAGGILITDKKFTIDLSGNTYTVTEGANTNNRNFKISGSSVVTIQNGTLVAAGDYSSGAYGTVRTEGAAMVTLKNLKLYNYRGNGLNVKALSGTKVIISDTEVYSQYGGGIESAGGIIELTNVKVEQKGMYTAPYNSMAISVNGGGTVTVNSGVYITECITAEEANNQGTSHGPWVVGVLNSGGTLVIKGGTFSNDNFGDNALAIHARGAVLADTGANIQINGGTFNALKDIIDYQNNLGDASKNPVVTIKGGTFSADPFAHHYVNEPDGYFATETDGVWTVTKTPEASVNGTSYSTLAEAAAAAKAGDVITATDDVTLSETLTLPAGVTFNGNGKQINGTIVAGGDLTFAGHTKVTSFSASYYNRTITIGEGACLEVTGTGRVSLAYGNTFDIIGDVTDAKTADKTDIQPSLIIPGGISITGGNNAVMSIKDAYVQIGSTTSKNSAANGTFTLNIENSIAEFTNQLTFSEPTNGNTPEFNMNIKNSVVTMGTKLIAAAPGCNIKVDNSTVNIATYFRNSGKFELVNGSVLTGSTIQFGENGGNDGETIVDNSKFTINATSAGHALDGKGTGSLTLKNGAEATVDYYKAMTVSVDATSTFTGTEVQ